ncbi:MAG: hypothetical protein ACOYEV_03570 [Candidatus Nanopelagicales bacterium]
MRKSMKAAVALAGAAVVVVAGTAFTDSNDFTADASALNAAAGYGTQAISGVEVTNVAYTVSHTSDISQVTAVVFTVTDDILTATHDAYMNFTADGGAKNSTCAITPGDPDGAVVTCTLTAPVSIETGVSNLSLTVTAK